MGGIQSADVEVIGSGDCRGQGDVIIKATGNRGLSGICIGTVTIGDDCSIISSIFDIKIRRLISAKKDLIYLSRCQFDP